MLGVVTGIPMEFQFGTNWSHFSRFAGGVIGQTLAMEGMFAFFMESAFLGLFLYGEKKLSPRAHWWSAVAVFLGSWLSGYFIIVTDAWMQNPVGYEARARRLSPTQQFLGADAEPVGVVAICAQHERCGRHGRFCDGFRGGILSAIQQASRTRTDFSAHRRRGGLHLQHPAAFPTGDGQGRMVTRYQPVTLAAMEALFTSQPGAPLVIIGQPDVEARKIDNPLLVPKALSFLTYRRWEANVEGLDSFPERFWPQNIPLLYYSYHIMVGLGTIFIAIMVVSAFLLWRGKLFDARWMLWVLLLSLPFPYIANTAGWMTAELGRQPWLVYGLMLTADGYSTTVSAGNGMFTLLGFMGIYLVLGILFLFLVHREIDHGPAAAVALEH